MQSPPPEQLAQDMCLGRASPGPLSSCLSQAPFLNPSNQSGSIMKVLVAQRKEQSWWILGTDCHRSRDPSLQVTVAITSILGLQCISEMTSQFGWL